MLIEENKAEWGLLTLTLEDYASLYVDGVSITGFAVDPYGNLAASFVSTGGDGADYFYYVTVKETEESFWLLQTACALDEMAVWYDSFAQWNATFGLVVEAAE